MTAMRHPDGAQMYTDIVHGPLCSLMVFKPTQEEIETRGIPADTALVLTGVDLKEGSAFAIGLDKVTAEALLRELADKLGACVCID